MFEGRRLSPLRVLLVLGIAGALVFGGMAAWGRIQDSATADRGTQWFGAYIDATSTPFYDIGGDGAGGGHVVLAFMVADGDDPCLPSWGGFYSMDSAAETFDLDRKVARVRDAGRQIVVSTGGLLNHEPAAACTEVDRLRDTYSAMLERYSSTTLDLDVEGEDLSDVAGGERRAEAIAMLQHDAAADGRRIDVWLTLPAATFGLTAEGLAEVGRMLDAGVDLAGVNLMTMNFGETREQNESMAAASIRAAHSVHAQLGAAYEQRGTSMGAQSLWRRIGLTPMIGQNDLLGEVFDLDDAAELNRFAVEQGVGRVSMWSANRDAPCGPNYPDVTRVSENCSGAEQGNGDFAKVLSDGLGMAGPVADAQAGPSLPGPAPVETAISDDPETSPYPVWNDVAVYVEGDRSVWRGNVYEAKWWNQNARPDAPVVDAGSTPWKLVGPVLPGDKPQPVTTVPDGFYPKWSAKATYVKEDRVLFEGRVVEAKWWNTAESPEAALQGSGDSPWKLLSNVEVQAILDLAEAEADAEDPSQASPTP
ncbi:chitinase [Zafaria sp. Z1313]|uniref:chitinase n=1 Tax=Zafaria sp. Z1313 TaxID=3423202 RepID=UPI003D301EFF